MWRNGVRSYHQKLGRTRTILPSPIKVKAALWLCDEIEGYLDLIFGF